MLTHWKNTTPPQPPFYAVIFISKKSGNLEGYEEMDNHLMSEAQKQAGFLGYSSVSNADEGIFISYWENEEAIDRWRQYPVHQQAKKRAPKQWYDYYHSMITKVESSVIFDHLR